MNDQHQGDRPSPPHLPPAPGWPLHPAMVTSDLLLPGFRIVRSYGIVRGVTLRNTGLSGMSAAMSQAFGSGGGPGVQKVIEVNEQALGEAFFTMLQRAAQLGANAAIGFSFDRFEQSPVVSVLAYGTAVFAEPH